MTYALARVVTNGSGFEAADLDRPAAGKTGTTNENKSAWFVGYTPEIAVAVSMSKSDDAGNPISLAGTGGLERVTGGSFPARMWTEFVSLYLEGRPVQNFPDRAGDVFGSRSGTGGSNEQAPATSAPRPSATTRPTAPPTSTPKPTSRPTITVPPTTEPPVTEPPDGEGGGGGGNGNGGGAGPP